MGHHITALIGKLPANKAEAAKYELSIIEENGFAIVPLNARHLDTWVERLKLAPDKIEGFFAFVIFGQNRYVRIETDYFGGLGGQAASVYDGDQCLMHETSEAPGAINKALQKLGVKRNRRMDEFETIGLHKYRDFDELYSKYQDENA